MMTIKAMQTTTTMTTANPLTMRTMRMTMKTMRMTMRIMKMMTTKLLTSMRTTTMEIMTHTKVMKITTMEIIMHMKVITMRMKTKVEMKTQVREITQLTTRLRMTMNIEAVKDYHSMNEMNQHMEAAAVSRNETDDECEEKKYDNRDDEVCMTEENQTENTQVTH